MRQPLILGTNHNKNKTEFSPFQTAEQSYWLWQGFVLGHPLSVGMSLIENLYPQSQLFIRKEFHNISVLIFISSSLLSPTNLNLSLSFSIYTYKVSEKLFSVIGLVEIVILSSQLPKSQSSVCEPETRSQSSFM